jgi:hypothetical protein
MLPTPSETPRKRPLQTEASLKSTARVLFPARPATIEEVVPTPRKSRKTKNLFTLESFANATEEPSGKIQIFTDSKERVPTRDDEDENPFVVKKGKGKAKMIPQKSRKFDLRTEKMNEAADRDEGMVYLFRGRKMFRKFHDGPSSNASLDSDDDQALPVEEKMLRRQVGPEAHRPLTRSSIKPRLLFKEEIKERNRQNGHDEDDEEAETEIEAHVATPSRKKGKTTIHLPVPMLETTPPPTVRKPKRGTLFAPALYLKQLLTMSQRFLSTRGRVSNLLTTLAAQLRAARSVVVSRWSAKPISVPEVRNPLPPCHLTASNRRTARPS